MVVYVSIDYLNTQASFVQYYTGSLFRDVSFNAILERYFPLRRGDSFNSIWAFGNNEIEKALFLMENAGYEINFRNLNEFIIEYDCDTKLLITFQ